MELMLGNFVGDSLSGEGELIDVKSPVGDQSVGQVPILDESGISAALMSMASSRNTPSQKVVLEFLARLKDQIVQHRSAFIDFNHLETGFIEQDNVEIIDALIEYLEDFECYAKDESPDNIVVTKHSYRNQNDRYMKVVKRPYDCVAVLVPQNASPALAVISIASALCVGAKVIVRPSLQCGVTGALLAHVIDASAPPKGMISVVNASAKSFLNACYQSSLVDVVHYIGSARYASTVLSDSFEHGKLALIDGDGNGMLYVDETFPLDRAVQIIVEGATRYNGETCTSINGVLIHPARYGLLEQKLIDAFESLKVGHPREEGVNVGPLFSQQQAEFMSSQILQAEHVDLKCGGKNERAYFSPAIITNVRQDDDLVTEGFFGPAVWLKAVSENELWQWLAANRFPLSDTILSHKAELIAEFASRSKAARICINEDPSIESMFEPWGGYPPGGLNPVSSWMDKYRQTIQLDGSLNDIQM